LVNCVEEQIGKQEEIGEFISASREIVTRITGSFKNHQLVLLHGATLGSPTQQI